MNYYDANGMTRPELLDTEANMAANSFVEFKKGREGKKEVDQKKSLSSSQLRKFFNEFRSLEKKVSLYEDNFNKVLPLIKMVKSKASYAANRSQNRIPQSFKIFLEDNINIIHNKKDFQTFMLYFEAVVGFFYGIDGVRND